MTRNKIISALSLLVVSGGIAIAQAQNQEPVTEIGGGTCPNTKCNIVSNCDYLSGVQCSLTGSSCTNTHC